MNLEKQNKTPNSCHEVNKVAVFKSHFFKKNISISKNLIKYIKIFWGSTYNLDTFYKTFAENFTKN